MTVAEAQAAPERPRCGATTRRGTPCRFVAGYKTDHVGTGRCHLHGGKSLVRHGRYSRIKRQELAELIAHYEADPDPLNLFAELAAARALFVDWIDRYETFADALLAWHEDATRRGHAKPVQLLDLSDAMRHLATIASLVGRIEHIRAQNAVSRPELLRIVSEMARAVELHVPDLAAREAIRRAWISIRL